MWMILLSVTLGWISGTGGILTPESSTWGLDFKYHDHVTMEEFLHKTVQFYPDFTSIYSIGKSVYGKELWVLKLSSPSVSALGTPHVKLIGNIHGNEPAGREILLHFIQYLLLHYPEDYEVQSILNSTVLHILPSMNPDGFSFSKEGDCNTGPGRENGNDVDLNRNFPDSHKKVGKPRQPETEAVINWLKEQNFVLSASLHGGALVANYPLDNSPSGGLTGLRMSSHEAKSADDDVFQHLARTYADHHLTMHRGEHCRSTPKFPGGITNGAQWYALTGGMQDFNYLQYGCMELTLEISCCKYPLAKNLPRLWEENKKALLELVKEANQGVRGQVLDLSGHPIPGVSLQVSNRNVPFHTSRQGEFWRILLPGAYLLQVEADGYETQEVPFNVRRSKSSKPSSTWMTIFMEPKSSRGSYISCLGVKALAFLWLLGVL